MAEITNVSPRRFVMNMRQDLAAAMQREGMEAGRLLDRAVRDQAMQTKAQARTLAASALGPRAANTIGAIVYSADTNTGNKPGQATATIFSRWIRKTGSKRSDIWGAYERGAIIKPVIAKALFINLRTRQRRGFRIDWKRSSRFAVIPLGQGNKLITSRGKKGEAYNAEALLLQQVTVKKRIDFDNVRNSAETGLYKRALAYLSR